MNKPPDAYKCIKKQIKDVFKDENDVLIINNAAKRSNQINIKVYMLLKIFMLNEYESLNHGVDTLSTTLPIITKDTIGLIQNSVCLPSKSGRKITDTKKILFVQRMIGIRNTIDNFSLVNAVSLSAVLNYQKTEIITVIENNIKQHFLYEYINRFVNTVFRLKFSLNPDMKKELSKVKNDLRNGTLKCNVKYHKWINKYRYIVLPKEYENSYHEDIQKNPQKYLVHMIWINKMLDVYGSKKYNFLPQRTDIICKYSQFDTKSMIELLVNDTKKKYLDNLSDEKDYIWKIYTNIKRKYNKDYTFDYCIITDGYACSIRYVETSQCAKQVLKKEKMRKGRDGLKGKTETEKKKKKADKEKKEKKEQKEQKEHTKTVVTKEKVKKYIEFPYIDEIDPKLLLSMRNVNFVDPGKRKLTTILKPDNSVYSYSNKKHIRYTKREIHKKKIEKTKKDLGIIEIETELSDYNSKSCKIEEYTTYCSKKLEINNRLEHLYEKTKFRQYKWYNYICRERRYDKMLNEMERELGTDAILIYGDASIGVSMRNFISTPNISMKRKLKERFKVLSIDEYKTSCINCVTHKSAVGHFKYKDKKNKTRSLHSVLTYKMENNRFGCINRDLNAVRNIKYIYDYYLGYLRKENTEPRPEIFSRNQKLVTTPL